MEGGPYFGMDPKLYEEHGHVQVTPEYLAKQSVPVTENPPEGESVIYRNANFKDELVSVIKSIPDEFNSTLGGLFRYQVESSPDKPFLGHRPQTSKGDKPKFGDFVWESYAEVGVRVNNFAYALLQTGLKESSTVGIYSINRPEWLIAEHACYTQSMIPVALYDTLGPNAVSHVINHAEIEAIVCSGKHIQRMLDLMKEDKFENLKVIVTMDECTEEQKTISKDAGYEMIYMNEYEESGSKVPQDQKQSKAEDLATIMYTSGSTGNPKGVRLTHKNFVAVCSAIWYTEMGVVLSNSATHISYLPLAHSFERAACSTVTAGGGRIGFFSGLLPNLMDDIATLMPDFLLGAPRVFTRIHDRLLAKVNAGSWLKRTIFNLCYWWKEGAMRSDSIASSNGQHLTDAIAFNKVKMALGGHVRFILSGSAPLDPSLGEFLRVCFCCPIVQGYGLTENVAGAFSSYMSDPFSSSHNGGPLPCTEFKFCDVGEMGYSVKDTPLRGEVCIRGNNVFQGYHKDPEKTAEDLQEDGWFHTGDIGEVTPNGTLLIVDRKKNIFKLSQGEYVAAEYLEMVYVRSPLVLQAFVYGDSFRNFLVAVIVPDPDAVTALAREKNVIPQDGTDMQVICESPVINDAVIESMKAVGKAGNLKGFEFVRNIILEPTPFSVENDLMTPSFKQRRPNLKTQYIDQISKLYEEVEAQMNAKQSGARL